MATASEPTLAASVDLEPASPEIKSYQRQKRVVGIASLLLTVVFLTLAALVFGPAVDRIVRGLVGDNAWLRLTGIAFVYAAGLELLTLPLDFWSGFVLEHRYQLSNETVAKWVWKRIKAYLLGGPLGLVMVLGLYTLLWYGGAWWWVIGTAALLCFTLLMGRILPVLILPLFYKVTRLDDAPLLERLRLLAEGTGLNVEGIYRLHLSEETRKANAALAGLGRTRRVLLGDTLLDGFTPEEIEVVFAHEVGHHVHRHLSKMVVVSVFLTAAGLWLVDAILRASAGPLFHAPFDDPAALPLVLLVLSIFGLLLSPAQNALSRFFEVQCDRYALERTRMAGAYRSAFAKLARMNKSDPDPHPVLVWLFYDHPPIRQRLALADKVSS
ncbi:MAG: M48 family metalloprotease [Gemmataceae bacterium]|nr:M48 family metalloprotease [Gemmataceae bacterium]